jgi:hypothetical protein
MGGQVITPDVVGMVVEDARRVAQATCLVLVPFDPDAPPLGALTWQLFATVTTQIPPPGTALPRWESLVVDWSSD